MEWIELGKLCEIKAGGTPSRRKKEYWKDGQIPWVKISDIKNKYVTETEEYITKLGLENSSTKLIKKGSILYTIFATIGKVGILDIDATTNQAIAGLEIKDDSLINKDFLYYFLISIEDKVKQSSRGVAQNNINMGILKQIKIPVPPMEVQEKIVKILNEAQNLIDKRKEQIDLMDKLTESIFYDMFGDPVSNSKEYSLKKISQLYDVTSSKRIYKENLKEEGVPFFKISDFINLIENKNICINNYISSECYKKLLIDDLIPKKNDLLITSRGTLGRCYIVKDKDRFYFQDGMITWLRDTKKTINSKYIKGIFDNKNFIKKIVKNSSGTTVNYISINMIKEIKIPVPPLSLQNEFAEKVETIEEQKKLLEKSLNLMEDNYNSLMQSFFKF